jgi:Cu(I)/Ag(I) efflux system protein CusF
MKTNRFAAAILVIGAVSAQAAPVPAKTGKGVGVITALDPHAAKLTIEHGAIPAVGWPAMTMTFAATPPSLLTNLHVGQKVGFDVRIQGMAAQVTAVRPQ